MNNEIIKERENSSILFISTVLYFRVISDTDHSIYYTKHRVALLKLFFTQKDCVSLYLVGTYL